MNYRFDLSTGLSEIKGILIKVSEHFDSSELNCHHCNQPGVKPELIANLEKIRAAMGMPINVHSGYRCAHHPIEAKNKTPGQHTMGIGADISVKGMGIEDLFLIIGGMPEIHGIGMNREVPYIHFDTRTGPRVYWKYTKSEKKLPWNGHWETL